MSLNTQNNKGDSIADLIGIVDCIGNILRENAIVAKVDFDHRDKIIIIKYKAQMELDEITCVINCNNKLVSGIDESKSWMPNYSKSQIVNKEILNFLKRNGFTVA